MHHLTCGTGKLARFTFSLAAFLFINTAFTAAQKIQLNRSHPVSAENQAFVNPVEGTLNVIGVMVEFQPDTNEFTSGRGVFGPGGIPYLEDPGTNVDALPHNRSYFEAHLEFAKNYFQTVSTGRLTINFRVLPDLYRLDKEMKEYSPIGETPSNEPLGELARDVWTLVEESGGFDANGLTAGNTAFVIFHAGIGRDIELTGTILDKTVQDIPSVYLSTRALQVLLDEPGFQGFSINGGEIMVNNSLIIPRTQSRRGTDISGFPFVLPLSVNGMLTAQLGSHIGLPDLFNTETGESGIGRFGLMDGAGIFAFNGLFPPELSAWEKQFLGWASADEADQTAENRIDLPAASLRSENGLSRISISADEYFLLENRHRDIAGNGVEITIKRNDGTTVVQNFTNLDTDFITQQTGFDQLLEPGVVTGVSNYDFALPGGLDPGDDGTEGTEDDRELNGGILIWHIDESVIRQKIAEQRVNADPERKGVELMEADGAQDIGQPTAIGIGQNEPNGSAFDFWWSGNDASVILPGGREITLFENRFGPDTNPNNDSNSGSPSSFELFDFSDNLPIASFSVRPVNPFADLYELQITASDTTSGFFTLAPDNYHNSYPLSIIQFNAGESNNALLIPGQNGVRYFDLDAGEFNDSKSIDAGPVQQPLLIDRLVGVAEKPESVEGTINLSFFSFDDESSVSEWDISADANNGFISTLNNRIVLADLTPLQIDPFDRVFAEPLDGALQISESRNGNQSVLSNSELILQIGSGNIVKSIPFNIPDGFSRFHTGVLQLNDATTGFYLLSDKDLFLYAPERNFEPFPIVSDIEIEWPAFADFDLDGRIDFLYVDKQQNRIVAKSQNGALLDHFPIRPPSGIRFTGTPLLADLENDGQPELLVTGMDSFSMNIFAYNSDGSQMDGFPLTVGGTFTPDYEPVHPVIFGNSLAAVSPRGDFKKWLFPGIGDVLWGGRYGNSTNNKISGISSGSVITLPENIVLNKNETYNWPNPARNETNLRYQTNGSGEISIKITTLSGRLIFDRTVAASGGAPEELLIDTSGWASGAYFALVKAKVDGREDQKIVKIAIVK